MHDITQIRPITNKRISKREQKKRLSDKQHTSRMRSKQASNEFEPVVGLPTNSTPGINYR
jgi:hypothetical protein